MSTQTSGPAIETAGPVKTFGETRAVDGADLVVPAGTVYGVLGPNGASRTTTVKMLATLLRPDGGEAHVFGHDIVREADEVRGRVSPTGQYAAVRAQAADLSRGTGGCRARSACPASPARS
ncbi:hypothetical protein ADK41_28935 [Streptomyces caelestis]|uniref:ABC transporter domain-containing protein n=1 Tax=Streptomyces caelestis TaxID=36816 RepID=A0A0M8QHH4_9ACTN|nr:hypothetical protein ADK41_28935 [Streptomyces caelestis]